MHQQIPTLMPGSTENDTGGSITRETLWLLAYSVSKNLSLALLLCVF